MHNLMITTAELRVSYALLKESIKGLNIKHIYTDPKILYKYYFLSLWLTADSKNASRIAYAANKKYDDKAFEELKQSILNDYKFSNHYMQIESLLNSFRNMYISERYFKEARNTYMQTLSHLTREI